MPPKFKYTRKEIIEKATLFVSERGAEQFTARSLAAYLGVSSKPIFIQFKNMEELKNEVIFSAQKMYESYVEQEFASGKYLPYKSSGIGYIRFAKEQKELFKLLFMRDRRGENIAENREEIRPILDILMQSLSIDEDKAYLFHIEMWIYVHGIATMCATEYINWDIEFISKTLTDIYQGLKHRFTDGE